MRNRVVLTLLLLLAVFLALGCGRSDTASIAQPSPTPSPLAPETVADFEADFQRIYEDDGASREEARRTASEFVTSKMPNWQIKGLSSRQYSGNIFWVDVDIKKGKDSTVISVVVRRFFPESGKPYWLATPQHLSVEDQLKDLPYLEILRQLDGVNTKLLELRKSTKSENQNDQ